MIELGLVAEDDVDRRVVAALARGLAASLDGFDAHAWDVSFRTRGIDSGTPFTPWTGLTKLPKQGWSTYRAHGKFDGEAAAPMAVAAGKALLHFLASTPAPEVIVLLKDGDQDPDGRRRGLAQARDEHARTQPSAVAIGVPRPEIEAWIVAGFDPQDDTETDALAAVRERIHFDPTRTPERLTSKHPSDPKDAERVRDELGIDADRETACLDELQRLRARGAGCGLAELLDDLGGALLPRLGAAR